MSLEIKISHEDLKNKVKETEVEYKRMINTQKRELEKKFSYRTGNEKTIIDTANAIRFFIANYSTFKDKLTGVDFYEQENPEIRKQYTLALASEATMQYLAKDEEAQGSTFHTNRIPKWDFKYEFTGLASVAEELTEEVKLTLNSKEAKKAMIGYFGKLKEETLQRVKAKDINNFLQKSKELTIENGLYKIKGLESILDQSNQPQDIRINGRQERNDDKLSPYNLEQVIEKDDIQGNEEPKEAVEDATLSLMCYKTDVQKNPFLEDGGFTQKILLLGDSGCGKSMIADYSVSLAKQISAKHGIPFQAVEFMFKDTFQYGPAIKIEKQFRKIAESNKTNIIVMNEFDGLLPSRDKTHADYAQEVVSEFLQMFDNKYPNKGNYILIATSNKPDRIDKAIKSRFKRGIFYCQGPITAEQKSKILQNNLSIGIKSGYVQIKDWDEVGRVAYELKLQGRDLAETAGLLMGTSRKKENKMKMYEQFIDSKYNDALALIKKSHNIINDSALVSSLYLIKEKDEEMKRAKMSYQGEE